MMVPTYLPKKVKTTATLGSTVVSPLKINAPTANVRMIKSIYPTLGWLFAFAIKITPNTKSKSAPAKAVNPLTPFLMFSIKFILILK